METSGSIQDPAAMAENKSAQAIGMHLYFPCGIIRGALSNLGIPCAVSADISNLPACESLLLSSSLSFSFPFLCLSRGGKRKLGRVFNYVLLSANLVFDEQVHLSFE